VPAIGGGDDNGIDFLVFQHLAEILDKFGFIVMLLHDDLGGGSVRTLVGVADVFNLYIGSLGEAFQEGPTAAPDAHNAHHDGSGRRFAGFG